jgi:spore maturation protein SpmA
VLNYIWLALVVLAVAIGGWNDRLNEVTTGASAPLAGYCRS